MNRTDHGWLDITGPFSSLLIAIAIAVAGNSTYANPRSESHFLPECTAGAISAPNFFVKNIGQYPEEILYYADIPEGRLWVRDGSLVIQLLERMQEVDDKGIEARQDIRKRQYEAQASCPRRISNVYVTFPGGDFTRVVAEEPLLTRINIFKGNDPRKWVKEIPTFRQVRVSGLFPGLDLILGGPGDSEAPWHLERSTEQADLSNFTWHFSANSDVVHEGRALRLSVSFGSYIIPYPKEAQKGASVQEPFFGSTALNGSRGGIQSFNDPPSSIVAQTVLWGTYYGGSGDEMYPALAVDSAGYVVLAGYSESSNLPFPYGYDDSLGGNGDWCVAKLSASGASLLWTTYIGGSDYDYHWDCALAIDASDDILLGGTTSSSDIPVPGGFDTSYNGNGDIYVAKLSPSGSTLRWGTYLGGGGR